MCFCRIGRSTGYKTSELETLTDGQMLVIGGKEIEVSSGHFCSLTRDLVFCLLFVWYITVVGNFFRSGCSRGKNLGQR